MLSAPSSAMGPESLQTERRPRDETGYASSSQCQISKRDQRAQLKPGISHPAQAAYAAS